MADRSAPMFCLVDPELADMTAVGHYHIYDRTVCEAAERLGYGTLILARKTIGRTQLGQTPVLPVFTYGIWRTNPRDYSGGRHRARIRASWRFFRELRTTLAPYRLRSDSLIFIPSVYGLQILGWALTSLWSFLRGGPKVVLLLRYQHDHYDDDVAALGFRILEKLVWAGHVRLVTDSERLVTDYTVLTRAPFDVVPIPHARSHAAAANEEAGRQLRFGTLGGGRDEKGAAEIIEAIELLNRHRRASDIQFVLHVHSPALECGRDKLARLKAEPPENVELIDVPLDEEQYGVFLHSLDVVVLPYWREVYRSRSSGPLAEAIAAGKPVIVTRDTWLDDEMQRRGAGVACADRSAIDLARAIMEAAARFEELQKAARARAASRPDAREADELVAQIAELFKRPQRASDRGAGVIIAPWALDAESLRSATGARIRCLVKFLSARFRLVCLGAPSCEEFDAPRNMIFRPVHGLTWRRSEDYSRLRGWLDGHAGPIDNLHGALQLVKREIASFLLRCWPRSRRLLYPNDRVFLEDAILALPAIGMARRAKALTILTNYKPISGQIRTASIRRLVAWLECLGMRRADVAATVTNDDHDYFVARGVPNITVPNCVDPHHLNYILPIDPHVLLGALFDIAVAKRPIVLFVGSDHSPNSDAAAATESIAAHFDGRDPGAPLFVIAGKCRPPGRRGNVLCVGSLEDLALSALYAAASLVLVPLRFGTGGSLKTLEAMALGKPVIGTRIAFRGIAARPAIDAFIEDDIAAYPDEIRRLLADGAMRARIGRNARQAAEPFFFWNALTAYGSLVRAPAADGHDDPEAKSRILTRAVEVAWQKRRPDIAAEIESWWLMQAAAQSGQGLPQLDKTYHAR